MSTGAVVQKRYSYVRKGTANQAKAISTPFTSKLDAIENRSPNMT